MQIFHIFDPLPLCHVFMQPISSVLPRIGSRNMYIAQVTPPPPWRETSFMDGFQDVSQSGPGTMIGGCLTNQSAGTVAVTTPTPAAANDADFLHTAI